MKGELADAAFLGEAVLGERPVHGLDDVIALAKLFQDCSARSEMPHRPGSISVARP